MATERTYAELMALLADNAVGAIGADDLRDLLESMLHPYGAFYVSTPAATAIANPSEWTKAAGTTVEGNTRRFTMTTNNRLTYQGTNHTHVHITASLSFTSEANNQLIGVTIAKNGTPIPGVEVTRKVGTGSDVGSPALHADCGLDNGDYLEIYFSNETSAGDVTMVNGYFFVMGMLT